MDSHFTPPTKEFRPDQYRYLQVNIDTKTGIAYVRINRPEKYNAMNVQLHWEIGQIWRDLDLDKNVKVIVITGNGKAFSAGGDMEMALEMNRNAQVRRRVFEDAKNIVKEMIDCSKPIISAVNGPAVGAGMVVAVMADISIASEKAVFGDGHTKLGVAAGDHACAVWPLAMGMAKAKLYLLTGENLTADLAEKFGLISEVVPHGKEFTRAEQIALQLANGPQHALKSTKFALNQWIRQSVLTSMDTSLALEMLNFTEPDVQEGVQSFLEKRKPKFPSSL
jgi:enoyl-CoA hydratase